MGVLEGWSRGCWRGAQVRAGFGPLLGEGGALHKLGERQFTHGSRHPSNKPMPPAFSEEEAGPSERQTE